MIIKLNDLKSFLCYAAVAIYAVVVVTMFIVNRSKIPDELFCENMTEIQIHDAKMCYW
jgi:hypothetical protein